MKAPGTTRSRAVIQAWVSSRPPNRLLIGATFFALSGALAAGSSLVFLMERSSSAPLPSTFHLRTLWYIALLFALGVGWMQAGRLLWQRRPDGVRWALLSLALFASSWLLGNRPTTSDILLTAFGLALIVLSRSGLAAESSDRKSRSNSAQSD
jgi:hypothetical protein